MPKKTKKEKILAEYRRRLKLLQLNQPNQLQEITPVINTVSNESIEKKEPIIGNEEDALITSYFKKDFKKSLFLITIVITLEISLYFATINNYLRLGK